MSSVISMEGMIEASLKLLCDNDMPEDEMAAGAFQNAHGVVIMESVQAGFLVSAEVGTGILLRHDKQTQQWSAPLAIGLTGVGAGFSMGAQKKHMIIFLNDEQMTKAMTSDFSLKFGFDQGWSIGKFGEGNEIHGQVGNKGTGVSSGHSENIGIYSGLQAETTAMAPRTLINKKFYGEKLRPKEIVFGKPEDIMPQPSEPLQNLHAKLMAMCFPNN